MVGIFIIPKDENHCLWIIIINLISCKGWKHNLCIHMTHTSTFSSHFIMKTEKYHLGFTVGIKSVKDLFRTALLMDPQHMH